MVHQFKDNKYEQYFYDLEKEISIANFKIIYYMPELTKRLEVLMSELNKNKKIVENIDDLRLLKNEITMQSELVPLVECKVLDVLTPEKFDEQASINTMEYLVLLTEYFQKMYDNADKRKNNKLNYLNQNKPETYKKFYDNYFNEHLTDMVKKSYETEKNKLLEYNYRLVQQIDPIYLDPRVGGKFDFRAHLYAPRKHFMGKFYDTFWFNMTMIWIFCLFLYLALYFEVFKRLLDLPEKIKMHRKSKK